MNSPLFRKAIVRPPCATFADGLTTIDLGKPDRALALEQHRQYCLALEECGLTLEWLEEDLRFPDSSFVEDVAILTPGCAILTHPGALPRRGEVASMRPVLERHYATVHEIRAPGTLDGGDICEAGQHFFIGISERTNEEGARQLAGFLRQEGYSSSCVDIRGMDELLHLKSGIAHLGDNRLVLTDALAPREAFQGYEIVHVPEGEEYAANCVRVNDYILLAAGYPTLQASLTGLGYQLLMLEMSEFQKMDGGLSCLSLRF